MALELAEVLEPISEDRPSGDDLSYDPARAELEQAFEISVSDPKAAAAKRAETDWRGVIRKVEEQFARSKDVWLAVYLCRAGAEAGSLETVATGAEALAALFERYWDSVHPRLDELGLPGRKTPCESLAAPGFLLPLERAVLVAHPRLGSYSAADFERFRSGGEAADGYGVFRAALNEIGDQGLREALDRLSAVEQALRRADAVFTAHAGEGEGPNMAAAFDALARMRKAVEPFLSDAPDDAAAPAAGAASPMGAAPPSAAASTSPGAPGRIESREDVLKALEAVCDYYRRKEPASPVPFALERARTWVTMDFLSILSDLAPDSAREAKTVLTTRPVDET